MSVHKLELPSMRTVPNGPSAPLVDTTGGGGDDGGMDRIEKLESSVAKLETDVSAIKGDVASVKSDVSSVKDALNDIKVTLASMDSKMGIGEVRAFVERAHTDVYKWMATIFISAVSVSAAIYFGIQRLGH
ncbi:hypothetical protein [Burkholderia cepacia]|uniref:hypothetical protein n=1 Tax=Burkholderia cepacia TaxID=292 RepID=UPI0012D92930|nr:hypothetical protein [Burkholderia cepacia]